MMKVSTKTEYGMRCMVLLARQKPGGSMSIAEISRIERVPKQYAQQIFSCLRRADLVKSIRGTQGGFTLARAPESISVGAVLRVLEGIPFEDACDQFNKKSECGHLGNCSIRSVWQMVSRRIWESLDSISLKQLMGDEQAMGPSFAVPLPVLEVPPTLPPTQRSA